MKLYIKSAGYDGYSMSNNARAAYADGEMPLSKWTKSAILTELGEFDVDSEIIARAKQLPLETLKAIFLYKSSWHHTSMHYNKTNFYSVNPEVTLAEIDQYIAEHPDTDKPDTPKQPEYKFCEVTYGEWEGSRSHPKLVEYTGYAIVVDNWAYVLDGNSVKKKKLSGSHFDVTYEYTKVPTDLMDTYINKLKEIYNV